MKNVKAYAFINPKTQSLAWTSKGHPAVWSKRSLALEARRDGVVPSGARLVRLEGQFGGTTATTTR